MAVFIEVACAKYKGGGTLMYNTTSIQMKETIKRLTQVKASFLVYDGRSVDLPILGRRKLEMRMCKGLKFNTFKYWLDHGLDVVREAEVTGTLISSAFDPFEDARTLNTGGVSPVPT
jgi:hypothetical protein